MQGKGRRTQEQKWQGRGATIMPVLSLSFTLVHRKEENQKNIRTLQQ
jgi:hypothetical protein